MSFESWIIGFIILILKLGAAAGTMSSLTIILMLSANGCSRPYFPARFGP